MESPRTIDICHPPETTLERWLLPVTAGALLLGALLFLFWSPPLDHPAPLEPTARHTISALSVGALSTPVTSTESQTLTTTQEPITAHEPVVTPEPPRIPAEPEPAKAAPSPDPVTTFETPEQQSAVVEASISGRIRVNKDEEGFTLIIEEVADEPTPAVVTPTQPVVEESAPSEGRGSDQSSSNAIPATQSSAARPAEVTSPLQSEEKPQVSPVASSLASPPRYRERTVVHSVVKGDTLWDIANRYLNDPWRFPELAKRSGIRNPDLIYPGNRVRLIIRRRVVNE